MALDVFISYSSHDQVVADAICKILESRTIKCWIAPRDITSGSSWSAAIIDGIDNSRIMVFLFSRYSNKSPQVLRELERAVSKGLAILPIRIEDVQPEKGVEYFISSQHWLDAFTLPLEPHLEALAEDVLELLDQTAETTTEQKSKNSTRGTKRSKAASSAVQKNLLALDPAIDHLVEILPDGRYRSWPLTRPFYTIGRERAKIALADRTVSRFHVALVQLGADWVAIKDSRTRKKMHISGWSLLQRTLRAGDVLRIGKTWLVYVPGPDYPVALPLRPLAGRYAELKRKPRANSPLLTHDMAGTLDDDEEDENFPENETTLSLLVDGETIHSSNSSPVLIGSHSSCAVQLEDAGLSPFHALLCWTKAGLIVHRLGGTIRLDDRAVQKAIVNHNQLLRVGDLTLQINIDGDPLQPATTRLRKMNRVPRQAALSAFYGPHSGETALLPPGRRLLLGKSRGCDLSLPKADHLADEQAKLMLKEIKADKKPVLLVKGVSSAIATQVNGETIASKTKMTPGDVLQFQKSKSLLPTALMLHFDLASESWL